MDFFHWVLVDIPPGLNTISAATHSDGVIARGKLNDGRVQGALDLSVTRLRGLRLDAWDELDDVEALRERAHELRLRVVNDLEGRLAQLTAAGDDRANP